MASLLLSAGLFASVLLLLGAWKRWRREGAILQMWLMVAAALVIVANIAIWVVPDGNGQSLITGEVKEEKKFIHAEAQRTQRVNYQTQFLNSASSAPLRDNSHLIGEFGSNRKSR